VWCVALAHSLHERLERLVGSDGAGAGLHDIYGETIRVGIESGASDAADGHPTTVGDRTHLPPGFN